MHKNRGMNEDELRSAGRRTEDDEDNSIMPELVSEEDFMKWREEGRTIVIGETDRQWALGRWIVAGEDLKEIAGYTQDQRFKNAVYKAAADITGYSVKTIKQLAYVVRNVPEELKEEFKGVTFAHLKLVAKYNEQKQREFLEQIKRSNLTVTEARDRVKFLAGEKSEKRSRADRTAKRVTWHCNNLMKALETLRDRDAVSPYLYRQMIARMEQARKTLAWELEDESSEPALVQNERQAA